jgi:hypothetical protein
MADIKWVIVRPWDGSKGCPPVARGKPCARRSHNDFWLCTEDYLHGDGGYWSSHIKAYRIPAEFDHLDDNGNPTGSDSTDADIVDRLRFRGDALDMLAVDVIEKLRGKV